MPELSVLIPARCEMFLLKTVEDLRDHIKGDTDIIVVLDGWTTDLPDDSRIKVLHYEESIGQRAGCNRAAEASDAKYLMKVDAHCSFDDGFDVKMLEAFKQTGDDVTMVPIMRNLHAFNWACPKGHIRYQSPSGPCRECGLPTEIQIVWKGKENPQSICYLIDSEPHFQYFDKFKRRPEGKKELSETLSLQGSCFMLTKQKWFELNICDEAWGSWGTQGGEVAVKTWLSGGRVLCNHRTWMSHMFRTQGGDFGFPYEQSNKQVEHAKQCFRDLFFENKWEKQIYPLSWLIERFAPVPGWTFETDKIKINKSNVDLVMKSGITFSRIRQSSVMVGEIPVSSSNNSFSTMSDCVSLLVGDVADRASSGLTGNLIGQQVTVGAMSLPSIDASEGSLADNHVIAVGNQIKVEGVAAGGKITGMMQDGIGPITTFAQRGDQPSVNESVDKSDIPVVSNVAISKSVLCSIPNPTITQRVIVVDNNLRENTVDSFSRQREGFGEILASSHDSAPTDSGLGATGCEIHPTAPIITHKPSIGFIYYSDNHAKPEILSACQSQIKACCNGHELISTTLVPMNFGDNKVLALERGYSTMFKQILDGIERSTADILFLVEHDVFYNPSHFDFIPPREDIFYYDENKWMVNYDTGHALFYNHNSTSMLCAYRELLLKHYRARVEKVEREGFTRRFGFEPGSHKPPRGCDDYERISYFAQFPSLDIRHHQNLTENRWTKEKFRNQRQLYAWKEDKVWNLPGWDRETLRGIMPHAIPTD